MTSGTLAATGAGKTRRSAGTVPLERVLDLDGRSNAVVRSGGSSTFWVISSVEVNQLRGVDRPEPLDEGSATAIALRQ
jgi:hypothetical protein